MAKTTADVKAIISKRLAVYLINSGFELIDVQPSFKNQGFIVFLFDQTDELERAINKYVSQRRGR